MIRIYVPKKSAARAVGADAVADAIAAEASARKIDMQIIRNGSRGLLWLEPFVEVETAKGRVAYGPVEAGDVEDRCSIPSSSRAASTAVARPDRRIPYLKNQERLTFARCGVIDPLSIDDYIAHGGFAGLKTALAMKGAEIVSRSNRSPACAAAAARASRPASSGRPFTTPRPTRNMSAAMPMKATAAPLPTAC